jgi:hypothetical protein
MDYAVKGRLGNTWATLILFEATPIYCEARAVRGGCRTPSGGLAGIVSYALWRIPELLYFLTTLGQDCIAAVKRTTVQVTRLPL